jgi:hypothetical protein
VLLPDGEPISVNWRRDRASGAHAPESHRVQSEQSDAARCLVAAGFVPDSPLEESGFEPSVPSCEKRLPSVAERRSRNGRGLMPLTPPRVGTHPARNSGVRLIRRWREPDSSHRFRGRRPPPSLCRLSFAPYFPPAGNQADADEPVLKPWSCYAGPMVRIRLPPASESANHRSLARDAGHSRSVS